MLQIHLRDLNPAVVQAWQAEFAGVPGVDAKVASVLDVAADAIVSPANSFGYMDGGVDLAYTRFFGQELQERLQQHLHEEHYGELPVGQAVIVPTGHKAIAHLVSAPTMRVPSSIGRSINVYLAFRAALIAIDRHNEAGDEPAIRSVAVPGLGTGIGEVTPARAARQMRLAFDAILGEGRGRRRGSREIWAGHEELLAVP